MNADGHGDVLGKVHFDRRADLDHRQPRHS